MGIIEKCCSSLYSSNDTNNEITSDKNLGGETNKNNKKIFNPIIEEFKEKILDLHNKLRFKYGNSNLKRNPDLDDIADEYVKKLSKKYNTSYLFRIRNTKINSTEEIIHIQECIYKGKYLGENVAISQFNSPEEIFNMWANERDNYNGEKFPIKIVDHFTQIIWKDTEEIGIGYYYDKPRNLYFTVILYYPMGNKFGEFPQKLNNNGLETIYEQENEHNRTSSLFS